jgi:hypothetical protein
MIQAMLLRLQYRYGRTRKPINQYRLIISLKEEIARNDFHFRDAPLNDLLEDKADQFFRQSGTFTTETRCFAQSSEDAASPVEAHPER